MHWRRWREALKEQLLWPPRIERFVEPSLLLHEEARHGYSLREELSQRGLVLGQVDFGNLYRTLRRMEVLGWVSSEWSEEGPGPLKRVYRLTEPGEQVLHAWAAGLRETKRALDHFLEAYHTRFPTKGGERGV